MSSAGRVLLVGAIAWGLAPAATKATPAAAVPPPGARPSPGARCPPLEPPLPPPPRVEASHLVAAVTAADRWIRRVAPDVCPTKAASVEWSGVQWLTVSLTVSVEGHPTESRLTMSRGCVPEAKPGCGTREEDWHPLPPEEQWLSARVLDAATAALRAHPEIVRIGAQELGLGSWELRHLDTTAGSTICVLDGTPWDPPSYRACWNDPRPVSSLWAWGFSWPPRKPTPDDDRQFATDHVRGFLTLGPFAGQNELWAVRFPEAERTLVGPRPAGETADAVRPVWFPAPQRRRSEMPRLPAQGWQPIPPTSPPDLGALEEVEADIVAWGDRGADLTALDLSSGVGTVLCARRDGAWSCAPPTFTEGGGDFHLTRHERAETLPSRSGPPWLLVQRSTIEDGGNGEGSGAGGDQFLEIYRQAGGTLRPVGSVVLGRMDWTTKRRRGGYVRSVARYAHRYSVVGPDCIRIEPPEPDRGWADGSFLGVDPIGTQRSRARLRTAPVPDAVQLSGIPTVHQAYQDANSDVEAHGDGGVVLRDFRGVWCLEENRLVRTSRADP